LTAAYDFEASISTVNFPSEVSKVASQTDVVGMQFGGAFVNQTTRLVVPAGAHVGATAAVERGSVEGGANVEGGTVLDVVVVDDVDVELLVVEAVLAAFLWPPLTWISTMMRMMAAKMAPRVNPRLIVVRRLRCFWMMDCFSARIAR
jgi:hypothetical protein